MLQTLVQERRDFLDSAVQFVPFHLEQVHHPLELDYLLAELEGEQCEFLARFQVVTVLTGVALVDVIDDILEVPVGKVGPYLQPFARDSYAY